jgi:2-desacetyl-2-hydroxyethyl bacteriochlorophyllide A dehydrogenase
VKTQSLWIVEPGRAEVREEELPTLTPGAVLLEAHVSAISPGTERLMFHGNAGQQAQLDATLPSLQDLAGYPMKYGYATVGRIVELGQEVDRSLLDRWALALHPHQAHLACPAEDLVLLPAGIDSEAAAFLPNVETSLSLVHDGRPLAGERVLVLGLGVVGQLTAMLLGQFPLADLVAVEPLANRRQLAVTRRLTAVASFEEILDRLTPDQAPGFDMAFELSGNPQALTAAINAVGYDGRVVIGSWYGDRMTPVALGTHFHRNHIRLISSQVSRIPPALRGLWTKARRFGEAIRLLPALRPAELITHRLPLAEAPDAYALLDHPSEAVGILILYPPAASNGHA